ncbi:MAG: hypothetical protein RID91_16020 [Azospirillaceae bacterium]
MIEDRSRDGSIDALEPGGDALNEAYAEALRHMGPALAARVLDETLDELRADIRALRTKAGAVIERKLNERIAQFAPPPHGDRAMN